MADRLITNMTNDYLTCSICFGRFKDPRMLPCGHAFCLPCLAGHISANKSDSGFACPVDRRRVSLADDNEDAWSCASKFESNNLLRRMLSLVEKESSPTSPTALDFFCFGCKGLVSAECAVENHRNPSCECLALGKAYQKALPCLTDYSKEIEKILIKAEKIKRTKDNEKGMSQSQQEALKEIEEFEVKLEKYFVNCKEQLKSLKEDILNQEMKMEDSVTVTTAYEFIKEVYTSFNDSMENKKIPKLMSEYMDIESKLAELKSALEEMDEGYAQRSSLEFIPTRELIRMIENQDDCGQLLLSKHGKFDAINMGNDVDYNFYDIAITTNYILVTDGLNNVLRRYSHDGRLIDTLAIENPCRITVVSEKEVAVTQFFKKRISIVSVNGTLHLKSNIRTKKPYVGIAAMPHDRFAVSYYNGVDPSGLDIINHDGKILKGIHGHRNQFGSQPLFVVPMFIKRTSNGNIVVCDYSDSNHVLLYSDNLELIWYHTMSSIPCGVTCCDEMVYVTLPEEGKVVCLLETDGEKMRTVVKQSDHVTRPYAVSFCSSKLAVTEDESDTVHVFDMGHHTASKVEFSHI